MGTEQNTKSTEELRRWLSEAPPGTSVPVDTIRTALEPYLAVVPDRTSGTVLDGENVELTWRAKLWLVPDETRLDTNELAEAIGRPRDWVYRQTAASADDRIPHKKLDGKLVFVASEIREWLRYREQRISL